MFKKKIKESFLLLLVELDGNCCARKCFVDTSNYVDFHILISPFRPPSFFVLSFWSTFSLAEKKAYWELLCHTLVLLRFKWTSDQNPHNSNNRRRTISSPHPSPLLPLPSCPYTRSVPECEQSIALTLKGCKPEIVPMTSPCR